MTDKVTIYSRNADTETWKVLATHPLAYSTEYAVSIEVNGFEGEITPIPFPNTSAEAAKVEAANEHVDVAGEAEAENADAFLHSTQVNDSAAVTLPDDLGVALGDKPETGVESAPTVFDEAPVTEGVDTAVHSD